MAKNGGSTGRVIAAGPDDRIFVFYSDHGAPGILGMPSGNFLYADQLHRAIKHRAKTHGFKEMVMYIEACESGSMFEGVLEDDLNVYATTAANGQESSWGCYCPGMDSPPPPEYFTCLGDLYSVSWLEDTDANDMTQESLKQQFQRVRMRTSQNFTFIQGSHVERFGELEMDEEPAATYLGELNTGGFQPGGGVNAGLGKQPFVPMGAVPQREADLMPLIVKASRLEGTEEGAAAAKELEAERSLRRAIDGSVHGTLKLLTQRSNALGMASIANGRDIPLADALMTEPVAAPVGSALVSDWDCLRAMVDQWQAACGPLGQYGMKNSRAFANLCNLGVAPEAMAAAARETCPSMGLLPAAGTVA